MEPFSLFILPFVYVHGGAIEFLAPFLRRIKCTDHRSRLQRLPDLDLSAALGVSVGKPSFLNPVKHRGERYTEEERKNKRVAFEPVEAEENREIAGERWVNEWSVWRRRDSSSACVTCQLDPTFCVSLLLS